MPQKKVGRPPSDNPKVKVLRIRVDMDTISKLETCTGATGLDCSKIIRKGIDMVYDSLKK